MLYSLPTYNRGRVKQNTIMNKIKVTRKELVNYLRDIKGYGEDEANKIASVYGTTYFNTEELKEIVKFNN